MAQQPVRLAAIQAAPVLFDKTASTQKACDLIEKAGKEGVTFAAFGETWLPGYPFWIESGINEHTWTASADYLENSIILGGPETDALCAAAKKAGVDVVIGVAERDPHSQGTSYCTALTIGREGEIINRHRKLKPTHAERIIWGDGDAAGLHVVPREYGRISALNCWEHQMMLPGYTLAAQGTQFHAAIWPGWEKKPRADEYCWARQELLSRAFASQSASYVVCAAGLRLKKHIPDNYKVFDEWEHHGHSMIIDPRGEVIAGPVEGEDMIIADADMSVLRAAKAACDIAGHYSRPDVFNLSVDDTPVGSHVNFLSDDEFDKDTLSDTDWEEIFEEVMTETK